MRAARAKFLCSELSVPILTTRPARGRPIPRRSLAIAIDHHNAVIGNLPTNGNGCDRVYEVEVVDAQRLRGKLKILSLGEERNCNVVPLRYRIEHYRRGGDGVVQNGSLRGRRRRQLNIN